LPPLSFGGASIVPPWLRFHIPLIEPDMQISRIRLSDKSSRFSRANAFCSFLTHLSEFDRFPNPPRSFPTYCVCLELRSLSLHRHYPGLQRYYETSPPPQGRPACPSRASGWSLLTTPWGFPCCVRFPCVHACRHYPRRSGWAYSSLCSPSRISLPRKGCRVGPGALSLFRGLLSVHSRYGACHNSRCHLFVTR